MTTKEFIYYANEHPGLCEKMAACSNPEEVYAIAAAEGLTDSQDQFMEIMTRLKNSMEISDTDLENVSAAGSTSGPWEEVIVASVSVTIGAVAFAV